MAVVRIAIYRYMYYIYVYIHLMNLMNLHLKNFVAGFRRVFHLLIGFPQFFQSQFFTVFPLAF